MTSVWTLSPQPVAWGDGEAVSTTLEAHRANIFRFIEQAQIRILRHQDDSALLLLNTYIADWIEFDKQCDNLELYFLDVQEGKCHQRIMLHKWNLSIFSKVRDKLLDCATKLVDTERNGTPFDTQLVTGVRDTFVNLSSDEDINKFYRHNFEKAYIEVTESFYKNDAQFYLLDNGVEEYLKYAEAKLNEEGERAEKYLLTEHKSKSKEKLMQSCVKVLVTKFQEELLAECAGMIDNSDAENLRLMFNLMKQVPDGIAPMRQEFEHSLMRCFTEDLHPPPNIDSEEYIEKIAPLFQKFNKLVEDAFNCDPSITLARNKAYKHLINNSTAEPKFPEHLANYCNVLLRKSNEKEMEDKLKETLLIFKYVDNCAGKGKVDNMIEWLKKVGVPDNHAHDLVKLFHEAVFQELKREIKKSYQHLFRGEVFEKKHMGKIPEWQYYMNLASNCEDIADKVEKDREAAITAIFKHLPQATSWGETELLMLHERLELLREYAPQECLENQATISGTRDFILCIFHLKQVNVLKLAIQILACMLTQSNAQIMLNDCFFEKWNAFEEPFPCVRANLISWIEVVRLCITCGASPSSDMIKILVSNIGLCSKTELVYYLETVSTLLLTYRKKGNADVVPCDLDVLSDLYFVTEDIRNWGNVIVRSAYISLENCLESNSIFNILLFIASKQLSNSEKKSVQLKLEMLSEKKPVNWLQRNVLHMAAVILQQKDSMEYISNEVMKNFLNTRDLHGSTLLHVACLHHNKYAISFLESFGANSEAADNFGVTPQALRKAAHVVNKGGWLESEYMDYKSQEVPGEEHVDVVHQRLCHNVMNAKSGVLQAMKPMMILSGQEAQILGDELKELFQRIMAGTIYNKYVKKFVIAGSLREKLKVGRLDEADIQIRLVCDDSSKWYERMHNILVKSLGAVEWQGIHLRLISVLNPWEFVWERPGPSEGITVSVDVVPVVLYENHQSQLAFKTALITGIYREHPLAMFLKWKECVGWRDCAAKKSHEQLSVVRTPFAYDWDVMDTLSQEERMGILMAKALLEAYQWSTKGQRFGKKLAITSYMVKTVFFSRLVENTQPIVIEEEDQEEDNEDAGNDYQDNDDNDDDNEEEGHDGTDFNTGDEHPKKLLEQENYQRVNYCTNTEGSKEVERGQEEEETNSEGSEEVEGGEEEEENEEELTNSEGSKEVEGGEEEKEEELTNSEGSKEVEGGEEEEEDKEEELTNSEGSKEVEGGEEEKEEEPNSEGSKEVEGGEEVEEEPLVEVEWNTNEDIEKYAEDGRVWACNIFESILNSAQNDEELNFWSQSAIEFDPGDAEAVADICNCLLERLKQDVFY